MVIHGTGFANISLSHYTIVARKAGAVDIPCMDVKLLNHEKLTCKYPEVGAGGCTQRKIVLQVANQKAQDNVFLCYVVRGDILIQDAEGSGISEVTAYEDVNVTYRLRLSVPQSRLHEQVQVFLNSTSSTCKPSPTFLVFNASRPYYEPQNIQIAVGHDDIDQDDDLNLMSTCKI